MSENVATLYNSPEGQLGPSLFGDHLHWGYWDAETADADFAAASDRLAQIMIGKTVIGPDQRFIDIGCGIGQPAIMLAKAKGCRVDGITISSYQQQTATAKAKAAGLEDRLHFILGDALDIPREDQTYDGGWFFESIFHMGHAAALREASRVLKPGATLVIADLQSRPTITTEFREFVNKHIHSTFVAMEDYPRLMADAGFELIGIDDITDNVMPYLVPKLKETLTKYDMVIKDTIKEDSDKMLDNWIYMFEYMRDNLGYMLATARKI
ncbi:hypothetical protein [Azospirillum argentinense]|uniref:methyltransferase domain-containing protein n=1 Tax=Azospirillum argentinense TaxID=2970906 RepID=UPI0032DEE13C